MKKNKIIKRIIIVVLIGIGIWALLPLFFDRQVEEALPEDATTIISNNEPATSETVDQTNATEEKDSSPTEATLERSGQFSGRNNYSASGTARLVEDTDGTKYLRFDEDFQASNGPDLRVYIGTANDRGTELGALKGNIGSQNYQLPADLDVGSIDTVTIFCRSFNADFGVATL